MKTLVDAIDALVKERTFTADALEGVVALKARAAALEKQLTEVVALREQTQQQLQRTTDRLNEQLGIENRIKAREDAVYTREQQMTKLERETAVAQAVSATWKEAVTLIFRNTQIRESMMGVAPHAGTANPNAYTADTVAVHRDVSRSAE